MNQYQHPGSPSSDPDIASPPLALAEFLDRCMGNTAVATIVLDKFETQLRSDIRDIEDGVGTHHAERIVRTAHALKGSAGAAAAADLQRLASSVEAHARRNGADAILQELSALRAEVERCLGYVPAAREALRSGHACTSAQPEGQQ